MITGRTGTRGDEATGGLVATLVVHAEARIALFAAVHHAISACHHLFPPHHCPTFSLSLSLSL
jgi:hypothetical protein